MIKQPESWGSSQCIALPIIAKPINIPVIAKYKTVMRLAGMPVLPQRVSKEWRLRNHFHRVSVE